MQVPLGLLAQVGLLAGVGYLMVRYGGCCGFPSRRSPQDGIRSKAPGTRDKQAATDPLQELKLRLARGEIDIAEYERLRSRLKTSWQSD